MIKFLIGGSPCTHWSIAQKNNREIEPEGLGWELFKNYLIAKEKFKPDFFLYENNKSAADSIKKQISKELGQDLQYINSALVSAQNRQRFYVHNIPNVSQPEDRKIMLKDILESGIVDKEKSYCLKHQAGNARDYFKKHHTQIAFESIRLGDIGCSSQAHRVYSPEGKSINLVANGGGMGARTGLYMCPIKYLSDREIEYMCRKTADGRTHWDYGYIHYSDKNKSQCITANIHKGIPYNVIVEHVEGNNIKHIHEVKNGLIEINGIKYPIKIEDGYYIIRKLTVAECCRLQTLPDDYCRAVSDTQAYKGLGNGWTAEVIIHILKHAKVPLDEEIVVLSMYDGIGTGRYCFDKMGTKTLNIMHMR